MDKVTENNYDFSSETELQKMPLNKTDGMSLQEKDKETPIQEDKVTEDTTSFTSSEPSLHHESSSALETPGPNDKPKDEGTEKESDVLSLNEPLENERNAAIDPVTKNKEPEKRSPIVEEPFTEKIVHKLYSENVVEEKVSTNSIEKYEDTRTVTANSIIIAEETQEEPASQSKELIPEIVAHQENNDDIQQSNGSNKPEESTTSSTAPGDTDANETSETINQPE